MIAAIELDRSREGRQGGNSKSTRPEEVSGERVKTGIVHCSQERTISRKKRAVHSGLGCCSRMGVEALQATLGSNRNDKSQMDFVLKNEDAFS